MNAERKTRTLRSVLAKVLFVFCLTPALLFACSQGALEKLLGNNLNMRLQFIKNERLMPVYEAASMERKMRAQELLGRRDLAGVCREVFGLLAIADDILAEGDGRTPPLKNPWVKCTPEKMFALMEEYDAICVPVGNTYVANCARSALQPLRREMVQLKAWAGKGDLKAARYVVRMCEIYTQMLEIIRQK